MSRTARGVRFFRPDPVRIVGDEALFYSLGVDGVFSDNPDAAAGARAVFIDD